MKTIPTLRMSLPCVMGIFLLTTTGCSIIRSVEGPRAIPAYRVPTEFLGYPKADMQPIAKTRLRQTPPKVYQLDKGDILGVYIENVLGDPEAPPPVHFDESGDRPPSIGLPIPVREDGTIAMPLVPPIKVAGFSLGQATDLIRKAYTVDKKILTSGKDRIIVTLMRRRQERILVVREESGGTEHVTKRGSGHTIDLDAYENDLLHALNATGGLPGLDAMNEIIIYRGQFEDGVERDRLLAQIHASKEPCRTACPNPDDPNVVKIPLRFHPECFPEFKEEDIILHTGDIVVIQSREREKYYTGGVLGGGEHVLPRDYDLDILQALAVAGGTIGSSTVLPRGLSRGAGGGGGGGSRASGNGGQVPPSKAIILRKVAGNRQIAIRIDLNRALEDPSSRVLIQPEDIIIVRYTFSEEVWNAALNLVQFNFLFNGFQGGGVR